MQSKIEPETGNIPEFRIPRSLNEENNQSYQYCFYDFKGPIMVHDDRDYKSKKGKINLNSADDEKLKV